MKTEIWCIAPGIAGSPNLDDAALHSIKAQGFEAVICLLDPAQQAPKYDVEAARAGGFSWHCIPIRDFEAPTLHQLGEFVRIVRRFEREGTKVLVHCEGGKGRTGTMAAAYWIACGYTTDDAIKKIRQVCPEAVETW